MLGGGGYAQQGACVSHVPCNVQGLIVCPLDAEECWVQMLGSLRDLPGLPGPSGSGPTGKFVEQYLTGEMRREYVLFEPDHLNVLFTRDAGLNVMKHLKSHPQSHLRKCSRSSATSLSIPTTCTLASWM